MSIATAVMLALVLVPFLLVGVPILMTFFSHHEEDSHE
jgi:uncharacterized membrane protein